jgi:hypothetical protein
MLNAFMALIVAAHAALTAGQEQPKNPVKRFLRDAFSQPL